MHPIAALLFVDIVFAVAPIIADVYCPLLATCKQCAGSPGCGWCSVSNVYGARGDCITQTTSTDESCPPGEPYFFANAFNCPKMPSHSLSQSGTPTFTTSSSQLVTPSQQGTSSQSSSPTSSTSLSMTASRSFSASQTASRSFSSSQTISASHTPSRTASRSHSSSQTGSVSYSSSQTASRSFSASQTATPSLSASQTATPSHTGTRSRTRSHSRTQSATPSRSIAPRSTNRGSSAAVHTRDIIGAVVGFVSALVLVAAVYAAKRYGYLRCCRPCCRANRRASLSGAGASGVNGAPYSPLELSEDGKLQNLY